MFGDKVRFCIFPRLTLDTAESFPSVEKRKSIRSRVMNEKTGIRERDPLIRIRCDSFSRHHRGRDEILLQHTKTLYVSPRFPPLREIIRPRVVPAATTRGHARTVENLSSSCQGGGGGAPRLAPPNVRINYRE